MKLYHIALNNLRRRKAKMSFVILSVIIGIATIVSVNSIVEAMKTEMTRSVSEFGVNVVITPDAGGLTFSYGGITLPEIVYDVKQLTTNDISSVENLPSRNMIKVIAPKIMGLGAHGSSENKVIVVGADLQQEFLVKPWLRFRDEAQILKDVELAQAGTDEPSRDKMVVESIDLSRQNMESIDLLDNQILVGSALAASWGVKEGDFVTISGQELEVFAILLESGTAEDKQILMDITAAQELLGRKGEVTVIELSVDYLAGSEDVLLLEIKQALPHTHITSLRQETLRRDEILMRLVRFGMAISILILLVGMMVVGLTLTNSVRERTREIGVFRAIGFRKSHIAKMILFEGVLISVTGGLMGFLVGTLIARYGGSLFAGMDITVPWRVDFLLISVGLAVLIGLLSSLYPAYQASSQDPVEALRFI